jgi:hypothetical protein
MAQNPEGESRRMTIEEQWAREGFGTSCAEDEELVVVESFFIQESGHEERAAKDKNKKTLARLLPKYYIELHTSWSETPVRTPPRHPGGSWNSSGSKDSPSHHPKKLKRESSGQSQNHARVRERGRGREGSGRVTVRVG